MICDKCHERPVRVTCEVLGKPGSMHLCAECLPIITGLTVEDEPFPGCVRVESGKFKYVALQALN
jgi:hypothetical protein